MERIYTDFLDSGEFLDFRNIGSGSQVIFPGSNFGGGQQASDPTRIRTDSVVSVDYHGAPTVTLLGKNTYRLGIAPGGGAGDISSGRV